MNVEELKAALARADELDEVWALLVDHQELTVPLRFRFECVEWTGNAYVVPDPAMLEDFVIEALLAPTPVPCTVARAAGVSMLNGCESCEPLH